VFTVTIEQRKIYLLVTNIYRIEIEIGSLTHP